MDPKVAQHLETPDKSARAMLKTLARAYESDNVLNTVHMHHDGQPDARFNGSTVENLLRAYDDEGKSFVFFNEYLSNDVLPQASWLIRELERRLHAEQWCACSGNLMYMY